MTNENIQLSLKITADLNDAKAGVNELRNTIKETASTAQSSNNETAESLKRVYQAQNDAMNRASSAANEEQKQAAAQEKAAKAAEVHKKHIEKLRSELDSLIGSIDPTIKALGKLDEQERKLRESKKAGLIDTESYDSFLGKINEQRESLSNVDKLTAGTKTLSLNSRSARRDFGSMIRQIASGNFSAAGNSLFNFGNATGKLPPLFSAATLSVTAFIAIAYGLYKAISTILAEQERFNRVLISTGNYAGTSAGGLETMSLKIGKVNHNYSETRAVLAELASKGDLSAKSIENITTAAAYMSAMTGDSAQDSVKSFNVMQDSVTKWALESNKQYHWLDLATYNRIAALEEQGKAEEAIAIATDKYASTMEQRVSDMDKQLNWLTRGWKKITDDVGDSLNAVSYVSRSAISLTSDEEELAQLEETKSFILNKLNELKSNNGSSGWIKSYSDNLETLQTEIDALQAKLKPQQDKEKLASEQQKITDKAIDAQKALTEQWKQNRSEIEKQADAIDEVRKNYESLWATVDGRKSLQEKGVISEDGKTFTGGQYDTDVKAITDKALTQYNQQLKNKINLQEKSTELAKAIYDTEQGQYKNASAELKAQVIESAKLLDAHEAEKKALKETEQAAKTAASETERFIKSLESQAEKQTQKTFASRQALINSQNLTGDNLNRANTANNAITTADNKKLNDDLQNQLNSLLLDPASIKTSQIDAWYQTVITQLKANNNTAGIDLIDQLLPLKKAQANIEQIKQQMQAAKNNQAQNEQRIQAQVISGLITEIEGQNQLVELHKQTATELNKSVPLLEKLAQTPGQVGKDASAALAQLELEVAQLNKTTDVLTNAFRNGLQTGIQGALQGLADGTNNLSEAITNLGLSVVNAMSNIASQGLAEIMMNGLDNASNLFSSLFSASNTSLTVDTAQSTIAATEMGTAITTATGVGSIEMGTSLTTAMATGTVGLTGALSAAFAAGAATLSAAIASASAGSSAMSGIAGAASASVAAATGGYLQGPGTGTSDSILMWGSNGEFMMKEASVKKYGVDFFHALNAGKIPKFASGGLVSNVRTPNAPIIDNSQQRQTSQTVLSPVIQQELVIDAGDMVSKGISSTAGARAFKTFIRANKQTIKQDLGI